MGRVRPPGQLPITPPSFLVMATTAGRGGIFGLKSGHRDAGFEKLAPGSDPGCCTATKKVVPSGVK